jgi:hypothetical protein
MKKVRVNINYFINYLLLETDHISLLPSERQGVTLLLRTAEEKLFEKKVLNFLSHDSIMSVCSNNCCKKKCIQILSPDAANFDYKESMRFVYNVRSDLIKSNPTKEKVEEKIKILLQSGYQGNVGKSKRIKINYCLNSPNFRNGEKVELCYKAFSSILELKKKAREKMLKAVKTGLYSLYCILFYLT